MTFKPVFLLGFMSAVALAGCGGGDKQTAETPATPAKDAPVQQSQAEVSEAPKPQAVPVVKKSRGAAVYKKCKTCHTLKAGEKHKVGPNLFGIMDAPAGQKEGFNYSKAMKNSGISWTKENLDGYLTRPNKFMPGNQMTFIGLKKPEDREAVIAYLKQETAP